MKSINLSNLVKFKNKSAKGKRTFAERMSKAVVPPPSKKDGGDYWVACVSALKNSFEQDDPAIVADKITELRAKAAGATLGRTKGMHQANASMLVAYSMSTIGALRTPLIGFKKYRTRASGIIAGKFMLTCRPALLFTFESSGQRLAGGIWFAAVKEGYNAIERGMFADAIYKLAQQSLPKGHAIAPDFCIGVDVKNATYSTYNEILAGTIPPALNATLQQLDAML